ncbi:MAG: PIN domain-containing protein [Deltaproteobacteria bacterium]|nr:PIN domain-containing protein [Deltaproteobacteria bacterium]
MDRLFVDTSAWYAFLNRHDPNHSAVADVLAEWEGRLLLTDYVFDELVTLIRARVGHELAVRAGSALRSGDLALLVAVEPKDIENAWQRFCRDSDKAYSFTDCCSFAVMTRLRLSQAAACDAHFRQAGFHSLPPR